MLAMTFGFVACSNEDDVVEQKVQPQTNKMIITATLDDEITRASLGAGNSVVWSENDVIVIPDKDLSKPAKVFKLKSGAGQTTATFEGDKLVDDTYDAFYGAAVDKYLPAEQVYDATKKIADAPMYASVKVNGGKVDASSVQFKNLCGLLKLSLAQKTGVSIRSIKMTAGQSLSGNFTLDTNKEIQGTKLTNPTTSVVLNCGDVGVDLSTGAKDFYFYLPGNSYTNVSFIFTTTTGTTCTKTLKSGNSIDVTPSKIKPITFSASALSFSTVVDDHESVDLDLPSGKKWSPVNMGAKNNYDYGDYYAWGEVATKTNFTQDTYVWYNTSTKKYNKYYNYKDEKNNTKSDGKSSLDSSDDAVLVNWGGNWHLPTYSDWEELRTNCFWVLTSNYNSSDPARPGCIIYKVQDEADRGKFITGKMSDSESVTSTYGKKKTYYSKDKKNLLGVVTAKTSTHIFIPFAGYYNGAQKLNVSSSNASTLFLMYWLANIDVNDENKAEYFKMSVSEMKAEKFSRWLGLPIRPILYPASNSNSSN